MFAYASVWDGGMISVCTCVKRGCLGDTTYIVLGGKRYPQPPQSCELTLANLHFTYSCFCINDPSQGQIDQLRCDFNYLLSMWDATCLMWSTTLGRSQRAPIVSHAVLLLLVLTDIWFPLCTVHMGPPFAIRKRGIGFSLSAWSIGCHFLFSEIAFSQSQSSVPCELTPMSSCGLLRSKSHGVKGLFDFLQQF